MPSGPPTTCRVSIAVTGMPTICWAQIFALTDRLCVPFAIPEKKVRAKWDDELFELTPAVAEDWPVGENRNWPLNTLTIGCQFDWFRKGRKRTGFHWPDAEGKPNGFRNVDWDMAKVFDPSHPRAASVVASTSDRENHDWVRIFVIHVGGLDYLQRTFTGQFTRAESLRYSPGRIGPTPPPELNGFDSASAAAVSRRHLCCDLFLLGQDGYVRTIWANDRETFPTHPWPLNPHPCPLARRGSPISAVSRALDQLDVFYVTRDHQLATQWWHPLALDWARNQRTLEGPLVAGGSNLAALPGSGDAVVVEDRLDVFYVGLNYTRPSTDPHWNDSWQVVHATWSTPSDWRLTPVPGLTGVAASSGVAAVHDSPGVLYLVSLADKINLP